MVGAAQGGRSGMSRTSDAAALAVIPRPAWRGWVAAAVGLVCAFLLLGLLADAFAPAPEGPAESSYATTPGGVAAWAELLTRAGHPVGRLRRSLAAARLPVSATLVVLGAERLTAAEGRSLARFVRGGGRLVIGGGDPTVTLAALLADPPRWSGAGPREFGVAPGTAGSLPDVAGVGTVISAGEGAWPVRAEGAALVSRGGAGLLLVGRLGRGRTDLLADPSVVENRLLASADNAKLALDLAGESRRPVLFAEALHGFGAATGLSALPGRWWLTLAGLMVAASAWALARGRRLGPPEPPAPAGAPPRSGYVDALAGALLRARDPEGVSKLAREALARAHWRRRR